MKTTISALHTSNAGVLLNIGRNTLGIDLFSRDPEGIYPDTPEWLERELWEKTERRELTTLLFTHGHGDHFCLPSVLEALRRNPELQVISTREVIQKLRQKEVTAGNLLEVSPEETGKVCLDLPGFYLELFNSPHMGEQYAGIQNLACLLETGGQKLLVPGDAWPTAGFFARVAGWSEEIDWMLAPFPLIGLPSVRRVMAEALDIQNILALHLPRPEADAQGWLAGAKAVCVRASDGLPMPLFGEELGHSYILKA